MYIEKNEVRVNLEILDYREKNKNELRLHRRADFFEVEFFDEFQIEEVGSTFKQHQRSEICSKCVFFTGSFLDQ